MLKRQRTAILAGFRRAGACFACLFLLAVLLPGCTINPELQQLVDAAQAAAEEPEIAQITSAPYVRETDPAFGLPFDPDDSINPLFSEGSINQTVGRLLYDGLFGFDEAYRPVAKLCESFSYSEGVYTIRLRPGLTFSDGTQVTAADAVYSIDLARTHPDSAWLSSLVGVVRVETVSELVLVLETAEEDGGLMAFLDLPILKTGTGESARPVGTGRYRLLENGEPRLEAVSAAAQLPEILLKTVRSGSELVAAFAIGEVDAAVSEPLSTDGLYFAGALETVSTPTLILHYIGVNTKNNPLDSGAVRRAVKRFIFRVDADIM